MKKRGSRGHVNGGGTERVFIFFIGGVEIKCKKRAEEEKTITLQKVEKKGG